MTRRILQYLAFIALSVGAFVVGAVVLPGLFASGWAFLVGWVASGIWLAVLSRRWTTTNHARRVATMHALNAQSMMLAGECAQPWEDNTGAHLCVRPYSHTGPHSCGICEEITR
ncbi:MAG: hypothetical protein JSS74_08855 [Actinobacteria bacterium]|nr:hypothetical protein [Actinomycetota bacterium]